MRKRKVSETMQLTSAWFAYGLGSQTFLLVTQNSKLYLPRDPNGTGAYVHRKNLQYCILALRVFRDPSEGPRDPTFGRDPGFGDPGSKG